LNTQGNFVQAKTWGWLPGWSAQAFGTTPTKRAGLAMVYDSRCPEDVMFWKDQTWTWDAAPVGWTRVFPSPDPGQNAPRYNAAMAYDAANDTIVLFGGDKHVGNCPCVTDADNETWVARRCLHDFNGDWISDAQDDAAFSAALMNGTLDPCWDLDADGQITQFDLFIFMGLTCP
jgi:hypothetical protein